jgi:GAF domain-containing protein
MAQTEVQKPEYLDLLNAISLQEERAGVWIRAWSDKTQDADLKQCLDLVAARETSHYHIFKRRIEELGFELLREVPLDYGERMRIATSDMPDSAKIKALDEIQESLPKPTMRERFEAAMDDETVDPLTRSLLRWFSEVETDSGKSMRATYAKVQGAG